MTWPESYLKEKEQAEEEKLVKNWLIIGIFNDDFTTVQVILVRWLWIIIWKLWKIK